METSSTIDKPKLLDKYADAAIFVIDDEKLVVEMLKHFLRSAGFKRVRGFVDSTTAMAKMRLVRPDVIFTDVRMPDLNGNAMVKLIRSFPHLRHVPIIAITADQSSKTKKDMIRNGAESVLHKPISQDVLVKQTVHAIDNTVFEEESRLDTKPDVQFFTEEVQNSPDTAVPLVQEETAFERRSRRRNSFRE